MSNFKEIIGNWVVLGRLEYSKKKEKNVTKELTKKFGKRNWKIATLIDNKLLKMDSTFDYIEESYMDYFNKNPEILDWLVLTAKNVYVNYETDIKSETDYSKQESDTIHYIDIAIRRVLEKLGKNFQGSKLIQIKGENTDGFILTTEIVPFSSPQLIFRPQVKGDWNKDSIESFYRSNKVLAVKYDALLEKSTKMIGIILRSDINMGRGKFCAQAAHAFVSLSNQNSIRKDYLELPLEIWTVSSDKALNGLANQCQKMNFNCSLIQDAGKTQIAAGTRTALGIGNIGQATFDELMYNFNAKSLEIIKRDYQKFNHFQLKTYEN